MCIRDSSNKMMTGELMEVTGNELKLVSLDGHRMSIRKVALKEQYSDIKVIVPGKTLGEISKILNGDNDSEVQIFFSTNHIMFEFDDTIVLSLSLIHISSISSRRIMKPVWRSSAKKRNSRATI